VYAPAEQEKGGPASKMFVFEAVTNYFTVRNG
jgi:hypothetical protein